MIEDPTDLEVGDVMEFLENQRDNYGAVAVSITVSESGSEYTVHQGDDDDNSSEE